ncbi:MAG: glycerol-3-phosphate acyltransferase [Acidimicrobiales bacterium]|nr:glycerol-3-phosphate acyltransferase [Acidimicrobiales bacterium]
MSGWIVAAGVIIVAYVIGTAPAAQRVSRRTGHDPTAEGSRNPGATNVYRLSGRVAGASVLAIDLGKGAAAAGLGMALGGRELALAAGAAAVLGHVVPVTRRLRGGKGVATAGGMALVLWPVPSVVLVLIFVIAAVVVRIAAVGSLVIAAALPVGVAITGAPGVEVGVAAGVAMLVVARHHENIRRLVTGREQATLDTDTDTDADTAADTDRAAGTPPSPDPTRRPLE